MPKCSVIIPVYNVEKYLTTALESVINQTFSDIEIICINDGSTDNSLTILENYAQKDSRIKLINQHNQGVSAARNAGLEAACGEYIMFLDPDDTYDLTLCEKVVEKINTENPDIVMWGHKNIYENKIISQNEQVMAINILLNKTHPSLFDFMQIQIWVWDKAFRKEFLEKNHIKFWQGITNAEDVIFCIEAFLQNPKYSFIPYSLAEYRIFRKDSALDKAKASIIKKEFETYKKFCLSKCIQKQPKKMQLAITERFLCGTIYYWKTLNNEDYRQTYAQDIAEFVNYLKSNFSMYELLSMKKYIKLRLMMAKHRHKKLFGLFDIRTTQTDKTYVVFGKRFVVKRKNILQGDRLNVINSNSDYAKKY